MLDLAPVRAAVVRCFGDARTLDAFPSTGAGAGRVAADELWLVGPRAAGPEIARRASAYLAGADPDALVIEHTEGWAAWSLTGPGARDAFARLADFPLPEAKRAFLQGLVAQVPAKILIHPHGMHVIVPIQLGHHIPARVMGACATLGITLGDERDLVLEPGGE